MSCLALTNLRGHFGVGNTVHSKEAREYLFIVYWPGKVKPGVSNAIVSQIDFLASLGAMVGQKADKTTATDSQDILSALLGKSEIGRESVIEEAKGLALRKGDWKYIVPGKARDKLGPWHMFNIPNPGYLFNIASDPGETKDLAADNPSKVKELSDELKSISGQERN